jgi:malonate transporter
MDVFLIIAPVFSLILIGYAASILRLLSEGAHRSLTEFAFVIAVPALMFRTLATAEFPAVSPVRVWAAYFGAIAITWVLAALATRFVLRRPAPDGTTIAMGSVYGNIAMLGIPICLATFGPSAAGPMALILSVNTPVLWLSGTLQMTWAERRSDVSTGALALSLAKDLARNPIVLSVIGGFLLRVSGIGLNKAADQMLQLLAQAAVPTSLIALGASLTSFRIQGQLPTLTAMCLLKIAVMPLVAWVLAFDVLHLPPLVGGVVVLFAAMPAGANVFIFATKYRRVVNSASGAVALGTLLSVITLAGLIAALMRMAG